MGEMHKCMRQQITINSKSSNDNNSNKERKIRKKIGGKKNK